MEVVWIPVKGEVEGEEGFSKGMCRERGEACW